MSTDSQPETIGRRMLSPQLRTRQLQCFRREIAAALVNFPDLRFDAVEDQEIAAFLSSLATCPIRQQWGGGGVNAALILWY